MKRILAGLALAALMTAPAFAADYVSYSVTTAVNATPKKTWSKIGGFCAIQEWFGLSCKITAGEGGVGTVRELNNGQITEMMVAKTPFSYTYIQPLKPDNLYHGTLQVVPDGPGKSRIIYAFLYDQAPLGDKAAQNRQQRIKRFTAALAKMKEMAESP